MNEEVTHVNSNFKKGNVGMVNMHKKQRDKIRMAGAR